MKHIKKFETTAGFEAERSLLALPNVSLVTQTNTINYLPEPEWVEINGVKWATMNLGAATMFDTGLYYQWGDTQGYTLSQVGEGEGKKEFSHSDYKYYDENTSAYTKYNETDGKRVLESTDDAVTANWGDNWRMPTDEEVESLVSACDIYRNDQEYPIYPIYGEPGPQGEPTIAGYYPGYVFIAKNDPTKTLFFPDSYMIWDGQYSKSNFVYINKLLERSSDSDSNNEAQVYMYDIGHKYDSSTNRYYGLPIRPVRTV